MTQVMEPDEQFGASAELSEHSVSVWQEGNHTLACLCLALRNHQCSVSEVDVHPAQTFYFTPAHRGVERENRGPISCLLFRFLCGCIVRGAFTAKAQSPRRDCCFSLRCPSELCGVCGGEGGLHKTSFGFALGQKPTGSYPVGFGPCDEHQLMRINLKLSTVAQPEVSGGPFALK